MHYFYILYSKSADRFYIGETSNLSDRLEKHNNGQYARSYTKIADDWKYILTFKTKSRDDALFIENFVKRMKSRKFIKKVIGDQSILRDILNKR